MGREMKRVHGSGPAHEEIERVYRERRLGFLAWAVRRGADAATAEDIVQDAFGKAVAAADALSFVEDVAAWIFTAMRNRLVDLWRGEDARRRAGLVDLPEDILAEIAEASGIDVHDSLVRGEIEDALETAIEALPERQQEVLRAQAIEGITFRELSVRTGVPIDTLMALKRRAIKKIAAALEYWMEDV